MVKRGVTKGGAYLTQETTKPSDWLVHKQAKNKLVSDAGPFLPHHEISIWIADQPTVNIVE